MAAHAKICISTAAALFGHATQAALAQPPTDQFSWMSFLWGGGWGHMFFGGFMMLVFWASLIALIVVAVRWPSSDPLEVRAGRLPALRRSRSWKSGSQRTGSTKMNSRSARRPLLCRSPCSNWSRSGSHALVRISERRFLLRHHVARFGLPKSMFIVMFVNAVARSPSGRRLSMLQSRRFGRPRQLYTGATRRPYVALDERR